MGQEFTLVVVFCFWALLPVVLVSTWRFVATLVLAFVAAVCSQCLCQTTGLKKGPRLTPKAAVAPGASLLWFIGVISVIWSSSLCGTAVVTSSTLSFFCPPSHAQPGLLMQLQPITPQQWGGGRQPVLPQPIKSPQDHSGPMEANSASSLWWSRHSSPLSPNASLNLTTSPRPGLYCSGSLMLNGN